MEIKKINFYIIVLFFSITLNQFSFADIASLKEMTIEKLRMNILNEIKSELKNDPSTKNLFYSENSKKILNSLSEKTRNLSKELQEELFYPFSSQIIQAAPGKYHTLVLSGAGKVYFFGESIYAKLGHENKRIQSLPKEFQELENLKMIQISSNSSHHLLLTEAREVYSFGNGKFGQLGFGNDQQLIPKKIETLADLSVIQAVAGTNHSLVLTEEGKVYSFGKGEYGQLGHGNHENQFIPKKIEALDQLKIIQIAAGKHHTLVLTQTGEIYSFGNAKYGQLGHGEQENKFIPKKIKILAELRVIQIVAGNYHSLFLTDKGEVYSFGIGIYGELGHGDKKEQLFPKKIEIPDDLKIIQISAKGNHTLMLSQVFEVYSFGNGELKQLGHGGQKDQFIPKKIDALVGLKVKKVIAGNSSSFVITELGEVYSFGHGIYYNLGHGDSSDKEFPTLIEKLSFLANFWNQLI